jgi:hypothetical protein
MAKRISLLKKALSKSFAMKDLGPNKKILDIKISLDRLKKLLKNNTREGTCKVQYARCKVCYLSTCRNVLETRRIKKR